MSLVRRYGLTLVPSKYRVIITPELYHQYINDPTLSFGHAWTLGACLMGITPWLQ